MWSSCRGCGLTGGVWSSWKGCHFIFVLQSGATPLCLAAGHDSISAVRLLLQNKADVNASWAVPGVGVVLTPLSLAAARGLQEVAAELIEAGAKINAINKVKIIFPN